MKSKEFCTCGADCDYGPQGCSSIIKVAGVNKKRNKWVHCCLAHLSRAKADCEKNGYLMDDGPASICWTSADEMAA